jgi:small subunit ribosomal protein S1
MSENQKKIIIKKKPKSNSQESTNNENINEVASKADDSKTSKQAAQPPEKQVDEKILPPTKKFIVEEDWYKFLDSTETETLYAKDIVKGTIAAIHEDLVYVDVGAKSEGIIEISEFKQKPAVGEFVDVLIVKPEGHDGSIELSKIKADEIVSREKIQNVFENDELVSGVIKEKIKGGFIVDIGLSAFLPLSQLEIYRVTDLDSYIGETFDFRIEKYEPGTNKRPDNIVLSRRVILEEKREKERKDFYSTLKVGDTVTGKVKTILENGVFLNIGPIDGFIPISELSWGHVKNISDKVVEKQEISAIVTNIGEDGRVSLSVKNLSEDPWVTFTNQAKVGDVLEGRISGLRDFGAFVTITEGVEGLVHISEMSWTKKINHPKELLKRGQKIECKILEINKENKRLSLGLRQVLKNPWDTIDEDHPKGSVVKGKIIDVSQAGIQMELEDGIHAFLPANDVDWSKKKIDPTALYKKGDEIDAVIRNIEKDKQRVVVSRKSLLENPYAVFISKHPKGSVVEGEITKITDFGAFVKLADEIEALIHVSNLSSAKVENVESVVKVGDNVKCVVVETDAKKQKIGCSIKAYDKKMEQMEIEKYMKSPTEGESVSFGDFLKNIKINDPDNNE